MKTTIVTAPAIIPVSVVDFKTHQRVDGSTEDTYIESLIKKATKHLEEICNRKFITQTWKLFLDDWPGDAEIELPYGKTQSVTSITYKDQDGGSATFASDNYTVDTDLVPGRVVIGYDKSWPTTTLFNVNPITVTFVCGYGDTSSDVPDDLRHAIELLAAHWYENREPVITGRDAATVNLPYAIDALIWNHRIF